MKIILNKLVNFIQLGFVLLSSDKSDLEEISPRSTYIGASEMSLTLCPHQIIQNKLEPKLPDPQSAVRFARGHAMEDKLDDALKLAAANMFSEAGIEFIRQVTYLHPTMSVQCHVDFQTSVSDIAKIVGEEHLTPEIMAADVVFWEVKSSKAAVSEDQMIAQLGIAATSGIKAVNFGIIVDATTGDISVVGPYFNNPSRYAELEARAFYLLECLAGRTSPRAITGIGCSFCQSKTSCPAYPERAISDDVQAKIVLYGEIGKDIKELEAQRELISSELKGFIGEDSKFKTAGYLVSLKTCPQTSSYDGSALAKSIIIAQEQLELLADKLTDSTAGDLFGFSASADIYNGIKSLKADLQTALETCQNPRSGYQKFEVKADKASSTKKAEAKPAKAA